MRIAYFAHELADAAVQKRVRMLRLAGSEVTVLGFARDRGAGALSGPEGIVLGETQNRKLLRRLFSVFGAIPRAFKAKSAWRDADLIIARNLEMLALVRALTLFGRRQRIAYECLDIHRTVLSSGLSGALVRAAERFCLRGAALIVTSSPAFERNYFRAIQHFPGRIVVAENKLLALTAGIVAGPESQPPWTIAWCGVLRCRESFDILRDISTKLDGLLRVEVWGAPALDQIPDFHDAVAATPHMTFHGAYQPGDLPAIYAQAHFSWAIDYYEAGGNSDWLLPNRLYESLSFACVPIAVAGVETARWLRAHEVGAVLESPLRTTLPEFLSALTPERYAALRDAALHLDPAATRLTDDGCRAFAAELAEAAA